MAVSDLILPKVFPADKMEKLKAVAANPDRAVQYFFKIKDKNGKIIDFMYNRPQKLHAERSSQFDWVLKARKLGISSRRIAIDLWKCATRKHQHRIALTHTGDASGIIMAERVMTMLLNCKYPLCSTIRNDYIYFPLTGSRYYILTT